MARTISPSIPEQQKQFKIAYRNWREQLRKDADRKRQAAKRKEKIENYWNFIKNNPYYVYEVDTETKQPKRMLLMWFPSPRSALMEWANMERQTSKYKVGKLTPEQGDWIIRQILRLLFGSKIPQKYKWWTPDDDKLYPITTMEYLDAEHTVGDIVIKTTPIQLVRMTRR